VTSFRWRMRLRSLASMDGLGCGGGLGDEEGRFVVFASLTRLEGGGRVVSSCLPGEGGGASESGRFFVKIKLVMDFCPFAGLGAIVVSRVI